MHRLARAVKPYDDDREFLLSYILSISVILVRERMRTLLCTHEGP